MVDSRPVAFSRPAEVALPPPCAAVQVSEEKWGHCAHPLEPDGQVWLVSVEDEIASRLVALNFDAPGLDVDVGGFVGATMGLLGLARRISLVGARMVGVVGVFVDGDRDLEGGVWEVLGEVSVLESSGCPSAAPPPSSNFSLLGLPAFSDAGTERRGQQQGEGGGL